MERMSHEDYLRVVRQRLVEAAEAYLCGAASLTETSRMIVNLAHELDDAPDDVLDDFRAIDSETHVFPIGRARELWSAGALARSDAEREAYEATVAAEFAPMCRRVAAAFGEAPPNNSLERSRDG